MFTLFDAFKSLDNRKEFENFLMDLCTPKEIKDLEDRFTISQYLNEGKLSQRAIAEKVGCSLNTVTRVSRFLKQEKYQGYKTILNRLEQHHRHKAINDKPETNLCEVDEEQPIAFI